jgi:RNA polymerase sigma-70 factor, ECF subfamily
MRQDGDIARLVIDGDFNAFEMLINRYRALVFGIVLKYVPRDRADEVAQDTFIEAFRSLGTYSRAKPFAHWLSKVAVRCCYGFWRRHYRNRETPLSSISEDSQRWLDNVTSASSREAFERESLRSEAAEVLRHALDRLSPEDRMVVTMVHLEELSVKEAAHQLGWSLVSVRVRAHRSRQKLRKILSDMLDENPHNREATHEKAASS